MKKTMIAVVILAASTAGICFANNTVGTNANPPGGTSTTNWNHNNSDSSVNGDNNYPASSTNDRSGTTTSND